MKYVILIVVGLVVLFDAVMFSMVMNDERRRSIVRCFVISDNASVYNGPGREFKEVRKNVHGTVDVVGTVGDWWKLKDGYYMLARHLMPMRPNEKPTKL